MFGSRTRERLTAPGLARLSCWVMSELGLVGSCLYPLSYRVI